MARPEDVEQSPRDVIIVLDWDDTILNTWDVIEREVDVDPGRFNMLQNVAATLIMRLKELGELHFVTSSVDDWIDTSCQMYLPGLVPYIEDVPKHYASEIFQRDYPLHDLGPVFHKYHAITRLLTRKVRLLSIGDSVVEYLACEKIISDGPNDRYVLPTNVINVKLESEPTTKQVIQQIVDLTYIVHEMCRVDRNISVTFGLNGEHRLNDQIV